MTMQVLQHDHEGGARMRKAPGPTPSTASSKSCGALVPSGEVWMVVIVCAKATAVCSVRAELTRRGFKKEDASEEDKPGMKRVRSRRLSEIGIEMMSGTAATTRGESGADRGGTATGLEIKVASNPLRALDLEAKVKALEAQIQRQEEQSRRQVQRQEERWQRKFENLLQRIEGQGDMRVAPGADLSNDKKDSEQRQKKTEWTNPLRSKGWGAKKKKGAQKNPHQDLSPEPARQLHQLRHLTV